MSRKLLLPEFIEKATNIHSGKFSYDLFESLTNMSTTKVPIKCNTHNSVFYQTPRSHLKSVTGGCCKCVKDRLSKYNQLTHEEYLIRVKEVHGTKYDYSNVVYTGCDNEVSIICPIDGHGIFNQRAIVHSRGSGCPKCAGVYVKSEDEFVADAMKIHGDRYIYDNVKYSGTRVKVNVKCKIHGYFSLLPVDHLAGAGCKNCFVESEKRSQDEFIDEIFTVHGNEYKYKLENGHIARNDLICIECNIHGKFEQRAIVHIHGAGCQKCAKERTAKSHVYTHEQFIQKCIAVHGDDYDYSETNYSNTSVKVAIRCKIHGIFWQLPGNHINRQQGCYKCNKSSKGEDSIRTSLVKFSIKHIEQCRFDDCRNKKPLPFDFYLPDFNTCIEYDGEQHFQPIRRGSQSTEDAEHNLIRRTRLDDIKTKFCSNNNIKLIRIPYTKYSEIESIIINELNIGVK